MFRIFKGSWIYLVVMLILSGLVQASEILVPLLKPDYNYLQKISMEEKPPAIDNLFSNSFNQVQKLSLGSAFFAAQKTVENLGCDLSEDDVLKVVSVTPYGDFIKDQFFQKGGTYETLANDVPAICYKWSKCKVPEVKFDTKVINMCQQDILNKFTFFYELYHDQTEIALELKKKNIFSDGDLANGPWDLLIDIQNISKVFLNSPEEPQHASFVNPNNSFKAPNGGDCNKTNLLGMIAFKLCWIESQYPPFSDGKTVLSIEEIIDEMLAIVENAKRSGALMEHTKTDEWWETSLQGVKLKNIFSIDFILDVKPLRREVDFDEERKLRNQQNQQLVQKSLGREGDIDTYVEKNKYNVLGPSTLEIIPLAKARSFNESTHWLIPFGEWLDGNLTFWTNMVGLFELFKKYSNYFYQKLQNR